MITRIAVSFILLASFFAATGPACVSTDQSPLTIGLSCDDFQKPGQQRLARDANVKIGQVLELTLCSNGSTGFQWEDAVIGDNGVVQQIDRRSEAPKVAMPGSPGSEKWRFKALKAGQTDIMTQYSRPWAGGEKGIWTFTLKVVVK